MSKPLARVGDSASGVCNNHSSPTPWSGVISTGGHIICEGSNVAIVGSTGTASCGHQFTITSGSAFLSANGQPIARVGDSVITGPTSSPYGVGVITSGATYVTDNS